MRRAWAQAHDEERGRSMASTVRRPTLTREARPRHDWSYSYDECLISMNQLRLSSHTLQASKSCKTTQQELVGRLRCQAASLRRANATQVRAYVIVVRIQRCSGQRLGSPSLPP